MNNEKRLRDLLFSIMLEIDQAQGFDPDPQDQQALRARISRVLQETVPARRHKLQPTGDAHRDRLVRARLDVWK